MEKIAIVGCGAYMDRGSDVPGRLLPLKNTHCIQLSEKTLHKALVGYENGDSPTPDETI